jgi:hypothetical protein
MSYLDNLLYRYLSVSIHDLLPRAVAVLVPALASRPVLQRVRNPQAWHHPTQMR